MLPATVSRCPRSPWILWDAMGSVLLPCADHYNRGLSLTETSKLVAEHGPKKRRGEEGEKKTLRRC